MSEIDPNISRAHLSDEEILRRLYDSRTYNKYDLYSVMAKRSVDNLKMKNYLFDIVKNENFRKQVIMGLITHAWMAALPILEYSNSTVKQELKEIISEYWTKQEKEDLLLYLNRYEEHINLLRDI